MDILPGAAMENPTISKSMQPRPAKEFAASHFDAGLMACAVVANATVPTPPRQVFGPRERDDKLVAAQGACRDGGPGITLTLR